MLITCSVVETRLLADQRGYTERQRKFPKLKIVSAKTRNFGAKARNLQRKNLQLWRKNSQLLKISKRKYSDNQLVSKHYNQP